MQDGNVNSASFYFFLSKSFISDLLISDKVTYKNFL